MQITEGVELLEEARAEGLLAAGLGLQEFTDLEQMIRSRRPQWLPESAEAWEDAARRRPDLVEEVVELAIDRGLEPARFAAACVLQDANAADLGEVGDVDRVLVACELGAWSATA